MPLDPTRRRNQQHEKYILLTVAYPSRSCRVFASSFLFVLICACAPRSATPTFRAGDFVESLGVCVHFNTSTSSQIIRALETLGLRRIRTDPPRLSLLGPASPYEMLAKAGVKATYFVNAGLDGPFNAKSSQLGAISALARRYPGSIEAVEGPNEVNNWPVRYAGFVDERGHSLPGGRRAAAAFQRDLYRAVRHDPYLLQLPVIAYTDIDVSQGPADMADTHLYAGKSSIDVLAETAKWRQRLFAWRRPLVSTEWGYTTPRPLGRVGVDAADQSDLILAGWAELERIGFRRTFLYELRDDGADPANPEDHYGLFRSDWAPKPAALALAAFIRIIQDPSPQRPRFYPPPFDGSVEGARSLCLLKSDGSRLLLIWNRADRPSNMVTLRFPREQAVTRINLFGALPSPLGRRRVFQVPYVKGLLVLRLPPPAQP